LFAFFYLVDSLVDCLVGYLATRERDMMVTATEERNGNVKYSNRH